MTARIGARAPAAEPTAFLSDIHGNAEALDAVLEELGRREVKSVVVLGDSYLGGSDPQGVHRRLGRIGARCLRGVSDTALVRIDPSSLRAIDPVQKAKLEAFASTRAALGELALHEIRKYPDRLRIPLIDGRELLAVHGSPADPQAEISHDMSEDEIAALLDDEVADVVVCGASHVPFRLPVGEVEVLSVGSVGAAPEGRVAHFAIVHPRMDGLEILQTYVSY